ncbi:MAG: endospore germination permease [Bacillota bacterium]|nr:endospore germination permease [Bacillota bacterium]
MSIDGKISARQIAWLVVTIRTAVVLAGIASLRAGVGRDAWISEIIGVMLMIGMAWLMVTLCMRFPDKSIIEISEAILGKFLGKLIGIGVLWFFLFATASLIRELGELMTTVFMPETPIIVFLSLITLLSAYAVRMGVESIARVNDVFFLVVITMFGILWALVYKELNFASNLLPIYVEAGWPMIAKGGIVVAAGFMLVLAIGMIFPYVNQQKRVFKMTLLGLIIQGIIITGTTIIVITEFGPAQAEMLNFHGIAVTRVIAVAEFLERVDAIFMTVWIISSFVKIALFYYCFVLGLGQVFNLEAVNFLIVPSGALMIALGMASFQSFPQLINFFAAGWVVHNWLFLFFIPVGLLFLSIILKKKES